MSYFQGFLIPVPTARKDDYLKMCADAATIFADYGATRIVECWGDDVPDGKTTDMKRAVQAKDDETIVFSWIEWPDRATCDAGAEKMQADERMKNPPDDMPFDGKRMIYAGFDAVFDSDTGGAFGCIDGVVAAVPDDRRQAFVDHCERTAALFKEKGALRIVDGWGANVPDGKVTDFKRAVQAEEGETVIFGWLEWPDKPTRDAGMASLYDDPRMQNDRQPWNGPTAIFGGFTPIFDTDQN